MDTYHENSDEFNTPLLNTDRWAYRTANGDQWGTGPKYVSIEVEKEFRMKPRVCWARV